MNKLLLATMSLALATGTLSAQSQLVPAAPVAKKSTMYPQGTIKLGELKAMPTHVTRAGENDINPKVLTNMPGWDRQVYEATGLNSNPGDTLMMATFYDPALLARFEGNTIKTIKSLTGPNMKNLQAFILDAQTGELLWEGKKLSSMANTTTKSKMSEYPCDYKIDKTKPIIVGWKGVMKTNTTSLGIVNNIVSNGLLVAVNNSGFMDLGMQNGFIGYIDCETEGEAGLKENDVEVLSISDGRVAANGEYTSLATFINYGTKPVSSVGSAYILDGKEQKSKVSGEQPFPYMYPLQLQINSTSPSKGSRYVHSFKVDEVNDVPDEYTAPDVFTGKDDNIASNVLTVTEFPYERIAVMEQYTGTWCGWCPRGHVAMEKAEKALGDKFIGIAVHANDPMQADEYAPFINYAAQMGGFPSVMVNRIGYSLADPYYGFQGPAVEQGQSDGDILNDLKVLNSIPSEAMVGLSSEWNEDETAISITGMMKFGLACPGKYYSLAYVLTEDGLKGYPQNNFYHESMGKVPSAEILPEDLRFLFTEGEGGKYMPTFNNVARSIKDPEGIEGSLDDLNLESGKTFTHTYTMPLPRTVKNKENLKLVVLLIDKLTNEIVTAQEAKVGEMVWDQSVGVEDIVADAAEVTIANGAIQVAGHGNVTVYTVDGKVVRSAAVNGSASVSTEGLKGAYVVRVVSNNNVTVKKVML